PAEGSATLQIVAAATVKNEGGLVVPRTITLETSIKAISLRPPLLGRFALYVGRPPVDPGALNQVRLTYDIITGDSTVKAILFNIFGGITRTDDVANGIVAALKEFEVGVPVVIRLTGTNEVEALRILEGVGMRALNDMDEAVKQVVALAREAA
ncbi:MAG: hypothetical protein AAB075_08365, partial [Gemmatimonadota bacterium]